MYAIIIRPHPSYTHEMLAIASCYRCSVVCLYLLNTLVSLAKTAEPIKMPFGTGTSGVQGSMYYMGPSSPTGKGALLGVYLGMPAVDIKYSTRKCYQYYSILLHYYFKNVFNGGLVATAGTPSVWVKFLV